LKCLLPTKEGANWKNYGSTVIPKARGVRKGLFCVNTTKETKDIGICLPSVEKTGCVNFFLKFLPLPWLNNMEEKTYPAMHSPVYEK